MSTRWSTRSWVPFDPSETDKSRGGRVLRHSPKAVGGHMTRISRIVLAALCLIVLGATAAHTAVVVEFVPGSAAPGQRVQMNVTGLHRGEDATFYLAPSQRAADAVTGQDPSRDPTLIRLRHVLVHKKGEFAVRFVVPRVAPGRHAVVVHCKSCASGGTTFSAVGDLKVLSAPALPITGHDLGLLLGFATVLLLLGATMVLNPRELLRGLTHARSSPDIRNLVRESPPAPLG